MKPSFTAGWRLFAWSWHMDESGPDYCKLSWSCQRWQIRPVASLCCLGANDIWCRILLHRHCRLLRSYAWTSGAFVSCTFALLAFFIFKNPGINRIVSKYYYNYFVLFAILRPLKSMLHWQEIFANFQLCVYISENL